MNIWPKARSFNPERSQPKDWIMSVAHHKIMDVIRSRRRTIINTDPADYETLDLQCSDVVDRFQATAAELAASVVPHDPPQGLRARVMEAISREEPPAPPTPEPQLVPSIGDRLIDCRLFRMLVPTAASGPMVLVVIAVTMNVRVANRVDELKQENASLQASLNSNVATKTAQTSQAAANESQVMDTVLRLQQASYELAQPDNISLALRSPYAGSSSQGILLVSSEGSRGMTMVAGMDPLIPSTDYHVWLMRGRDKVWVGRVGVDAGGWGTVSLQLPESIIGFEKVELTAGNNQSTSDPQKDMVLEDSLVSMTTPRMVTYATLR